MALPLDVLEKSLNKRLAIHLKGGRTLEGKLAGYDQYMNLVLEETEEKAADSSRRLGVVVLRGNNVETIAPRA